MAKQVVRAPLAARDGVAPSRVWCPKGPWVYLDDFLLERFSHMPPSVLLERLARGDIVDQSGIAQQPRSYYQAERWLWYFREVPQEIPVPFELPIIYQDHALIVVDKPHFLATTPGGRYLQETALTRLRRTFDDTCIAPLHRLDRETAGVLLFSRLPAWRGAYQQLFQQRQVYKQYEAVAPFTELRFPRIHRSRMAPSAQGFTMQEVAGEPNSCTRMRLVSHWVEDDGKAWAHYELEPETGKKHQLRVHMSSLGIPIRHDGFYPVLQPPLAAADFSQALQLLARCVAFVDPISGQERRFESRRALQSLPHQ